MSENIFWIRCWLIIAAVLISGMGACTFNSANRLDKWEKAVANGADPMVVSCALYDTTRVEGLTCHVLAQNRK